MCCITPLHPTVVVGQRAQGGVDGIKWMVDRYDTMARNRDPTKMSPRAFEQIQNIQETLQRYRDVAQRVSQYSTQKQTAQSTDRMKKEQLQQALEQALVMNRERTEARYLLCIVTGDFRSKDFHCSSE